MTKRLIAAGADVDAACDTTGDTPLHVSMRKIQSLRVVKLLIEVGWCTLTASKPMLKALMVSALGATM